ncbi:carbohydrate ABC transporter permease [Hamadaea tsunoensis]|uniref:carbohydrate ABC transporter permease n=1 Tax=Hamadaea tsunoensis TaxID=53368 RepID=UPI000412767B|nr:carbohydrate ABC transporter permease [Hamadaea tsunoensis]
MSTPTAVRHAHETAPVTPTLRHRPKNRLGRQLRRMPLRAAVALLLLIEIYPLVWLILSSLKQEDEFSLKPVWALPEGFDWANYSEAWTTGHMSTYLRNSLLATVPSLAAIIVFGVAAGFALQVMVWRGRGAVLLVFLAGVMVPLQMVLLPLFTIYFKAQLINSLWSLIITYTAFGLPLTVFLMAGYFRAIPPEVLEASFLDGAGIFRTFAVVVLPMVRNAILTIALVQFFFIWNDLLLSLTFISDDNLRTVQTGLLNFVGQYGQRQWGPTFASICLTVVPTLLLYLALNQKVMKGLTAGSVKG